MWTCLLGSLDITQCLVKNKSGHRRYKKKFNIKNSCNHKISNKLIYEKQKTLIMILSQLRTILLSFKLCDTEKRTYANIWKSLCINVFLPSSLSITPQFSSIFNIHLCFDKKILTKCKIVKSENISKPSVQKRKKSLKKVNFTQKSTQKSKFTQKVLKKVSLLKKACDISM